MIILSGTQAKTKTRTKSAKSNIDDVAVLDEIPPTDFSLQKAIAGIEGRLDQQGYEDVDDDDIVPSAAAEMGAGVLDFCLVLSVQCVSLYHLQKPK
jgi:hypothetical protein